MMRLVVFVLFLCGAVVVRAAPSTDLALENGSGLSQERPVAQRLPSGAGGAPDAIARPSGETSPLYLPGQPLDTPRPLGMPAWQQQRGGGVSLNRAPPFGAHLFQGRFARTYHEGLNPAYVVMPGDRILVRIWGARGYTDTLMVDPQGNIFIPEVGPLGVAGLSQRSLQTAIRAHVISVFLSNVEVYATLLSAQPVGVYVTGFVPAPGRYAGGASDSLLYYLDKAGGIIAARGSYRDIRIMRGNRLLAAVDLYPFLLSGHLPSTRLQDGDVILVGPRKGSVTAVGLIPQYAAYESAEKAMTGAELLRFASPHPQASHVSVTGVRGSRPFHTYLALEKLGGFVLENGDTVDFLADIPGEAVLVSATGAIRGASRYPVRRATTLRQLLAYVAVNTETANPSGIYIKRRSVAEQQRKAIQDSLYRLENSVLTASSPTADIAAIRVQEAQLVQNFVQRVAKLEPDGVVVVSRGGEVADILLEEGDEVVIPQRSDVVQITGEVRIPKSVVYEAGLGLKEYIASSGGFSERADEGRILIARQNGEILEAAHAEIQAGDLLMVMPYYDPKKFQILKDVMGILYQIAVATKVVVSM